MGVDHVVKDAVVVRRKIFGGVMLRERLTVFHKRMIFECFMGVSATRINLHAKLTWVAAYEVLVTACRIYQHRYVKQKA